VGAADLDDVVPRRGLGGDGVVQRLDRRQQAFDDCDMLTWSLGWTGVFDPSAVPASWQQRLDITSLTFMLNWVPLPVIQTCSGNMS